MKNDTICYYTRLTITVMGPSLALILLATCTKTASSYSNVQAFSHRGGVVPKTSTLSASRGKNNNKPTNSVAWPEYSLDESESTRRLVEHLLQVEECEGLEAVNVGFDRTTNLRGLYAKQTLEKGDYVCAIPFVATILLDETFYPTANNHDDGGEEESTTTNELRLAGSRLQNAVNFLQMVGQSDKELERLYRDCLPMSVDSVHFSPTPDFWTAEEIKELELPAVVKELLEHKQDVQDRIRNNLQDKQQNDNDNDYLKSKNTLTDALEDPVVPLSPTTTEEALLYALWLVRSRAFTTLKKAITLDAMEGLLQRTVLIPFLDLINHQITANVALQVIESKEYNESFYALVAQRTIRKGEELTICYGTGEEASWEVYTKYGFWPQGHEKNGQKRSQNMLEPPNWTTTLEEDLKEQRHLSSSTTGNIVAATTRQSILDFRIRLKQIECSI